MNERLASLLAGKILGGSTTQPTEDGKPGELPPFVAGLLARFGITPESIMAYANAIKQSVAAVQYNTAFAVEQNKVIINNQRVIHQEIITLQEQIAALSPDAASKAPIPATMDGTPVPVTDDDLLSFVTIVDMSQNMDPSKHN